MRRLRALLRRGAGLRTRPGTLRRRGAAPLPPRVRVGRAGRLDPLPPADPAARALQAAAEDLLSAAQRGSRPG